MYRFMNSWNTFKYEYNFVIVSWHEWCTCLCYNIIILWNIQSCIGPPEFFVTVTVVDVVVDIDVPVTTELTTVPRSNLLAVCTVIDTGDK